MSNSSASKLVSKFTGNASLRVKVRPTIFTSGMTEDCSELKEDLCLLDRSPVGSLWHCSLQGQWISIQLEWVVVLISPPFFSPAQGCRKTPWHGGRGLSRALTPQLIAQPAPSYSTTRRTHANNVFFFGFFLNCLADVCPMLCHLTHLTGSARALFKDQERLTG